MCFLGNKIGITVFGFLLIITIASGKALGELREVTAPVPVAIIHEYEPTKTGYRFRYETGDGSIREEYGDYLTEDGQPKPLTVNGIYSYFSDDDVRYDVLYRADENGYHTETKSGTNSVGPLILRNSLLSLVG